MAVVVIPIFMVIVEVTHHIIFHPCRISQLPLDCLIRIGETTLGWMEKRPDMCKMGAAATATYRITMVASRSRISIAGSSGLEISFRMS